MSLAASFAILKMYNKISRKNPKWKSNFILSSVLLICSQFEGRNCDQGRRFPAYRQTVVPKTVFVHLPDNDPMSVMHLGMT